MAVPDPVNTTVGVAVPITEASLGSNAPACCLSAVLSECLEAQSCCPSQVLFEEEEE